MESKSNLNQLKNFYYAIDSALATNSHYRRDIETVPVAVGTDAGYLLIEQRIGESKLQRLIKDCKKELPFHKRHGGFDSRFGEDYEPTFSDVDLYLTNPHNIVQIRHALNSLGYHAPNNKSLESKGYAVFLNKNVDPVKVEVMVKTKNNHVRPNSSKSIDTVLPHDGNIDAYTTRLDNMQNLLFIEPIALANRLTSDIAIANEKKDNVPIKMFQDLHIMSNYVLKGEKI